MAKTAEAPTIENVSFDEYEGPETKSEGKYDAHVAATLERDEKLAADDPEAWESGKRTRVNILVPKGDEKTDEDGNGDGTFPDVAKEKRLFQESARYRDRTARLVGEAPQGDGYVKLSFILIPKQSRPRKAKDSDDAQGVDESE